MKRNKRWSLIAVGVALALVLALTHSVFADVSITVYPTFLEFSGDPGASTSQVITIQNDGNEKTNITVGVGNLRSARPEDSAITWLSTDRQHIVLDPGQSEEVKVTIRIPKNATPGGHYAAVYVQAGAVGVQTESGTWGGGTGVGANVLCSFLITIRSPQPTDLKLEGAVAKIVPVAKGQDKLGFRVEIQNTGNVHFVPRGGLELKNEKDEVVGTLPLPEGTPVLPGATRSYYFSGALEVKPGNYRVDAKINYSWEKWQAERAEADPGEWSMKEDTRSREFNSVPRLVVKAVNPVVQADRTVRIDVQVENIGDVEVAPQGYLDVLLPDNQRLFATNLGSANGWVEPGTSTTASVEYGGVLPKGDYTVRSVLNYNGVEEAKRDVTVKVDEDVIPVPAPNLPSERKAQLAIVRGVSTWVLAVAVCVGVIGAIGLTIAVQKYHLLAKVTTMVRRGGRTGK